MDCELEQRPDRSVEPTETFPALKVAAVREARWFVNNGVLVKARDRCPGFALQEMQRTFRRLRRGGLRWLSRCYSS